MFEATKIPKPFLRCISVCSASAYNLTALAHLFKKNNARVKQSRDVLHAFFIKEEADVFFFSHGSFVSWGLKKKQEQELLQMVSQCAVEALPVPQIDRFCFCFGEETTIDTHERFKIDVITLDSNNAQMKLAMSYGLAQSIKLEVFEDAIQDAISKNVYLPQEIARKGGVSLSRNALFQRIGEIFIVRSSINLSSEYLESPEFFWRNPNLEPAYIVIKKFLDIPPRVAALNQKLDVLQELLDILNSQVQHRHSSLLEMIIIILITIEIFISLVHWV